MRFGTFRLIYLAAVKEARAEAASKSIKLDPRFEALLSCEKLDDEGLLVLISSITISRSALPSHFGGIDFPGMLIKRIMANLTPQDKAYIQIKLQSDLVLIEGHRHLLRACGEVLGCGYGENNYRENTSAFALFLASNSEINAKDIESMWQAALTESKTAKKSGYSFHDDIPVLKLVAKNTDELAIVMCRMNDAHEARIKELEEQMQFTTNSLGKMSLEILKLTQALSQALDMQLQVAKLSNTAVPDASANDKPGMGTLIAQSPTTLLGAKPAVVPKPNSPKSMLEAASPKAK